MATSGQSVLQLSRDDIVNSALRKLLVLGEGQTANSTQLSTCTMALNAMVSEFRALGMAIWKRTDTNITLITGQDTYIMGVGQSINVPYPLHMYQVRFESPPYDTQIDVNLLSFNDFNLLPNGSNGITVNANYQPGINLGTLSIWPSPDASVPAGSRLVVTYQIPFDVFVSAADTPDFPQEWGNALIYGLALLIADEYGVPEQKKMWLEKQADKHLSMALSNGAEDGSMFFQPGYEG